MDQKSDFVMVFETGNAALLAVAKSILDGTDIAYIVKNENLQNLFGVGVIGAGYNVVVGPMQIQVTRENHATARTLLSDLGEGLSAAT